MRQYIELVSVCRPPCGPVCERVYQCHLEAVVDVWDGVVFSFEDHWSIDGRQDIVEDLEKWQQHLVDEGRDWVLLFELEMKWKKKRLEK